MNILDEPMDIDDARQLIHDGVLAFARAERQGIRVDMKYVLKQNKRLTRLINKLTKEFEGTKFCKDWKASRGKRKTNIAAKKQR